jgi:hypothetical protein
MSGAFCSLCCCRPDPQQHLGDTNTCLWQQGSGSKGGKDKGSVEGQMCLACDTCVLADFKAPESQCSFQLAWYVGVDVVFCKQANVTNATSNRCTAQLWFIELMVVSGRAMLGC